MSSTAQYQNPCRDGVREKCGHLQVLRHTYGEFEIWETIPNVLPDGRVMRRIGEQIELDCGTYKVIDVTESCALCESTTKKVVQYTANGGKEVKFTATRKGHIRVSTYREARSKRRGKGSSRVL